MAQLSLTGQQLSIIGEVNFDNADQVLQQGLVLIKNMQSPLSINLSQLVQGNSLVLAVIVQWLRSRSGQTVTISAVSPKMQGVIRASNLEFLIQNDV